jgi:hypothetical protein
MNALVQTVIDSMHPLLSSLSGRRMPVFGYSALFMFVDCLYLSLVLALYLLQGAPLSLRTK